MRFIVTIETEVSFGHGKPTNEDYARAAAVVVRRVQADELGGVTIKSKEYGGCGGATLEIDPHSVRIAST